MAEADAQASFAVNLEDGTSGAAEAAATALQRLRDQLEGDTAALRSMQAAMKNLQGGTNVNIQAFRELRDRIAQKKQAIADAQTSYVNLGGTFTKTARSGRDVRSRFAELAKAAQGMPGPLGAVVARLGNLRGMLVPGVIALGIVAIVAGLGLLVAATAAAAAALLRYGIAQADARRSELLRLEGLTKLRNWYGIAAGNAGQMQETIDRVSASVALGRGKVAEYTEQLYRMGLRGANLEAALEGVAIKAAVQGDAHARAFAGWAAGAARTGQSVRKLADDVKARLGGTAARMMLSLSVQSEKLRESFAALTSGLKIEKLLEGLSSITQLFSQNTATGRALKHMLERMFQPFIDSAAGATPLVKRFFQGVVLGALRIENVLLRVRLWFKRTFGASDILKGFDATRAAVKAGELAIGLFVTGLVAAAVIVGALVASMAAAGALLAGPFVVGGLAVRSLIDAGAQLYKLWQEIDWSRLGRSIIDGIVGGLNRGAKWVVDAVRRLGKSAWAGFKSALGIASPSKAFAQLGLAIPQGIEGGVEQGTPAARRAVASVIATPAAVGVATPRIPASVRGDAASRTEAAVQRSASVTIGEIHLHTASEKPRELALDFKRELERVLHGVAFDLGAGPLPEGA